MPSFLKRVRVFSIACALLLVLGLAVEPALAEDTGDSGSGNGIGIGVSIDLLSLLKKKKKTAAKKVVPAKASSAKAKKLTPKAGNGLVESNVPAPGETRFRGKEVLFVLKPDAPAGSLAAVARAQHLVRIADADLQLLLRTVQLYAINDGRSVARVVAALEADRRIEIAQPNYIYQLADSAQATGGLQYANIQLNIPAAQKLATGKNVVVALIDSRVDVTNMDIGHAVIETFSPAGNASGEADDHGTAMAGAIAGQGALTGIAPGVKLLAVESFVHDENGNMNGTSFNILRGVDWAYGRNAVIQNMSFAGPKDALLNRLMAAAVAKGSVFLAAAGNAGPKSQPLYPAADASVIAITAIDQHDQVFKQANQGNYIAVAAPGVDVIVYRPGKTVGFSTGTSVATAQVSGLAALAVERAGQLNLAALRSLLASSAQKIDAPADAVGAGRADALRLIQQADALRK